MKRSWLLLLVLALLTTPALVGCHVDADDDDDDDDGAELKVKVDD